MLPSAWPMRDKRVMYLYYPMAPNPQRMDHYQLYSAAYRVTLDLEHGTTDVAPLGKPRRLGSLVEGRPSSLERRELEISENALFRYVLAGEQDEGENSFWGYLKYFHEHPRFARDIERHAPRFVRWLRKRG